MSETPLRMSDVKDEDVLTPKQVVAASCVEDIIPEEIYLANEAATLLGVSLQTVRRACRSGKLPAKDFGYWKIRGEDLRKFAIGFQPRANSKQEKTVRINLKPLPSDEMGFVYFIAGASAIKVGFATDVQKRLQALQTSCWEKLRLLAFIPASVSVERRIQKRFQFCKLHGEWFSHSRELLEFIESVRTLPR